MKPTGNNKSYGGNARNSRTTFPNKQRRREDALARQEAHDKLTLQQKYDKAVKYGHPDTREAKRLKALLDKQQGATEQPAGEGADG